MRAQIKCIAVLGTLTLLGAAAAEASVIGVSAVGGSEGLLNLVNASDNSTMSFDIGEQTANISIGDSYTLPQSVLAFITGAGTDLRYSLIAGSAANGTSAATYLHSSDNDSITSIANGVRGTWFTSLNTFIVNRLNSSNPTDTDTAVNNAYGPFASGVSGNYLTMGTDDWGQAGTCVSNDNGCNLGSLASDLLLYVIGFGTSPTGLASITPLGGGAKAVLDLTAGQLQIQSTAAVPVPAAVWLFGTAFGLVGMRARRRRMV